MAINKKLIHFKNKSKFNEELANNNINDTSICFIQDTQEIWTHGQLYNCASIPSDQGTLAYAEYTGISTTAEVDTKSGYFPETLTEGASVAVKFEGNISHISTLNVNGTGAKNVYYKGNSLSGGSISRYNTYLFVYDGSYYRIVGVDTDTHYTAKNVVTSSSTSKSNATATNGNVRLNLIENSAVRSTHKIVGTGATTVTSDSSGNITIDTTLPNYIVPFTESDLYTWLNAVNDNDYFTSSALADDLTNISNAITNNVPLVLQGPNTELFPVVGHVSSGFLSLHILTFWENEPTSWLLTYNITSHRGDIRKYSIVDYATNKALASALTAKQDTLVSGETIKTINGTPILGSGDIAIESGENVYTWSAPTDITTGTVTPEEYTAIKEASQVYIEREGVSYQASKMDVGTQGMLFLSVVIGMSDGRGNNLLTGLYFEIYPDFTFVGNTFIMSIPTKTSQLINDSNFVTYAEFEWDGSSEGTVTSEKFEELRNANIVIVKQQDGDMIAHACKTSGGAVIFYYSTTMNNETSSAMFIVMDHDYSWTYSTSQTTIPAAVTESTVSGWGFTKNTGTYSKPSGGIPKTDLTSAVQTSLSKADTALQEESYKGTIVAEDANIPVDEPWDMSFAVLPNGNVSVTVNGVSNTFMPATPSGDPMHDIFVKVGAEYNNTGEDIVRTSIYGDNIIWKNAHWWLNDLGDITTDEMRDIYLHSNITQAAKTVTNMLQGITTRTNIATWTGTWSSKIADTQMFGYCSNLKTARLRDSEHYTNANATWMFAACANLEKIFPTLNATSTTNFNGAFDSCASLKEIRLKALGVNCSFATAQNLSNASILYMIDNANASKTITITLHANAYDRAMADSNIVTALSAHSNITLAKA